MFLGLRTGGDAVERSLRTGVGVFTMSRIILVIHLAFSSVQNGGEGKERKGVERALMCFASQLGKRAAAVCGEGRRICRAWRATRSHRKEGNVGSSGADSRRAQNLKTQTERKRGRSEACVERRRDVGNHKSEMGDSATR